jgi:hypothetical protein
MPATHETLQKKVAHTNTPTMATQGNKGLSMPAVKPYQLKEDTVQRVGPEDELPKQGKFTTQLKGPEDELPV